jgi:hypothetical protein
VTDGAALSPSDTDPRRFPRWVLIAAGALLVCAIAVWLRYRALGTSTLWLDDAWVAAGARFPTVADTIRSGLTSPGFSVLYRAWAGVFGTSATTAQLLALTLAVAAPVLLFLAAVDRGLPLAAALLGGALLATAPAHIDMSDRLKQYTAEAFATTAVLWVAWRVIDRPSSAGRWVAFTAVTIGGSLLSSVVVVFAGCALAACLVAAWLTRPRPVRPAIVSTATLVLVAGSWMLVAVRPNVHDTLTDYWRGSFLDGSGFAGGLETRLRVLASGFQGVDSVLVLVVLLIAAGVVVRRRPVVALLLLLPTLVAIALAAMEVLPLGTGRTDVYLLPTYALLVAVATAEVAAMMRDRAAWVVPAAAITALILAVAVASPAPRVGRNCGDPPVRRSELVRCRYPAEDVGPLVRLVERSRRPGDVIVVYPSTGYAYGVETGYAIARRPDDLAPTQWVVDVRSPDVSVLQAHREDPEQWGAPLDRIIRGAPPRIWLTGSHLHRDWKVLKSMLMDRGYSPARIASRAGARLEVFLPTPRAGATPTD